MAKKRIPPKLRRIRVYRERNRVLNAMGYRSYAEYLRSDTWAEIRLNVHRNVSLVAEEPHKHTTPPTERKILRVETLGE